MTDLFNLRDRVIVVTGGLGQLGRQFTKSLVAAGARVAVFDLDGQHAVAEQYFTELADRWCYIGVDVTSRTSLEEGLRQVVARWGPPFGLVNNAALDSPPDAPLAENGPFETYPEASFDRVMDVNVKGVFLCCQVIGAAIAAAGRGSIVNVSSMYGLVSPDQRIYDYRRTAGHPFFKPVAYSISKSSLYNLTRYLATYWAATTVRVNTVTFAGVFNGQDEQFLAEYCRHVPLGRMASEEEYNGALIFLMSDASGYMTGSNLVIDGGWTAW